MTCKYCEGNLIEFNESYACDKCGTLYKKENEEFINITCPKCGGELENGVCTYCTNEIVIKDEEEEEALFCPECGTALNIHGHCPECGSKMDITFEE